MADHWRLLHHPRNSDAEIPASHRYLCHGCGDRAPAPGIPPPSSRSPPPAATGYPIAPEAWRLPWLWADPAGKAAPAPRCQARSAASHRPDRQGLSAGRDSARPNLPHRQAGSRYDRQPKARQAPLPPPAPPPRATAAGSIAAPSRARWCQASLFRPARVSVDDRSGCAFRHAPPPPRADPPNSSTGRSAV